MLAYALSKVFACVEIKVLIITSSSTPSTRRLLDGVAMPVPRRWTEQHGRVIAEKRVSEELWGAPDALVDFHTGRRCSRRRGVAWTGCSPWPTQKWPSGWNHLLIPLRCQKSEKAWPRASLSGAARGGPLLRLIRASHHVERRVRVAAGGSGFTSRGIRPVGGCRYAAVRAPN